MRLLPFLLMMGCAYEAPDNPFAEPAPNVITGMVSVSDVEFTFPVVLLLTDAANPGPPSGTGSPATFTTVPGTEFTRSPDGTRSAPFAFTNVPDGSWVISAVMDGDRNFHPSVPTLAGASCRDVIGVHPQSLSSPDLGVVEVSGGEIVEGIAVLLAAQLATSRPTFTVSELADQIDPTAPFPVIRLESSPIAAAFGEDLTLTVEGPFDPTDPDTCDAAFWVHPVDNDGDGLPDPHPDYPPELGVADVWPRVYLEWMGLAVDSNGDDIIDTFDRGQRGDARFITEGLPWFPQLVSGDPEVLGLIGQTFPATTLDVAFAGSVQQINADGTTAILTGTDIPEGGWSVTVVLETGQTWTVPNELDTAMLMGSLLPPPGVTSARDAAQGAWVQLFVP